MQARAKEGQAVFAIYMALFLQVLLLVTQLLTLFGLLQLRPLFLVSYTTLAQSAGAVKKNEHTGRRDSR